MSNNSSIHEDGLLEPPYAPVEVSALDMAFPAQIMHLLPPWSALTRDQQKMWDPWCEFIHQWFFRGLPADSEFYLKLGPDGHLYDGDVAIRHMQAVLGSFQPKQQHKFGGLAFLCERWFDAVVLPSLGQAYGDPAYADPSL